MMRRIQRSASSESLGAHSFQNQAAFQRFRGKLQLGIRGYKWVNIEVPNELWGAASLAIKLTGNGSKLARAASAHVVQALAPTIDSTAAEEYYPQSITEALDFSPKLTLLEDTACLLFSFLLCFLFYTKTSPSTVSPYYALGLAALCFSTLVLSRSWLLERHFKAVQRSERDLASPDSLFFTVQGVSLHYKKSLSSSPEKLNNALGTATTLFENPSNTTTTTAVPTSAITALPSVAIHCLHGFGASLYSWSMVSKNLAAACDALVTSHDSPGFGLSQRPVWRKAYSLAFNGRAASSIMDAELEKILKTSNSSSSLSPSSSSSLKKVLIGHSMGAAAAAEGVIRNPENVDALILVAPAIVALWTGVPEAAKQQGSMATGIALAEEFVAAEDFPGEILVSSNDSDEDNLVENGSTGTASTLNGATKQNKQDDQHRHHHRHQQRSIGRVAAAIFQAITSEIIRLILLLATPGMVLLLRKLVRTRSFWEKGLASAWYDKTKISRQYVDSYRLGQLVNGWEYGILRFMSARFSEKAGFWHAIASALDGDGHLSQAERLAAACARNKNLKILIIHGRDDSLVPLGNSRRLAKVLPGAQFVEIANCGHMPQEECAENFVHVVENFINNL